MKKIYVVSELSVIANSMSEAVKIYASIHECMENWERCKSQNENKKADSDSEYEKRFDEWIKNLHPTKREENKFFSFTENANDTINAYNDYIRELNDSDSEYDKTILHGILSEIKKPYEIRYEKYERKLLSFPLPNMEDVRTAQNDKHALCEYIAKNDIHIHIAKGIIKNMASNPINTCNSACLEMVNNRFNDKLFEDITQEIYIALHDMVMKNVVTISNDGKLEFTDYENSKGETKSYFMKLFSLIQNIFVKNRSVNYARTDKTLDDCTTCKDIIDFVQYDDLMSIISNDSFKSFIHYISVKDSKNFDDYKRIISALLCGKTYKAIDGLSERRVKYLKSKLEKMHSDYFGNVTTRKVEFIKYESKTEYTECGKPIYKSVPKKDKNGNIKRYSYEYHYYRGNNWNKRFQNA